MPPRSAFDGKVGWFGGADPACRLNNETCGPGAVGSIPGLRKVQRIPANMRLVYHGDDATAPRVTDEWLSFVCKRPLFVSS